MKNTCCFGRWRTLKNVLGSRCPPQFSWKCLREGQTNLLKRDPSGDEHKHINTWLLHIKWVTSSYYSLPYQCWILQRRRWWQTASYSLLVSLLLIGIFQSEVELKKTCKLQKCIETKRDLSYSVFSPLSMQHDRRQCECWHKQSISFHFLFMDVGEEKKELWNSKVTLIH